MKRKTKSPNKKKKMTLVEARAWITCNWASESMNWKKFFIALITIYKNHAN